MVPKMSTRINELVEQCLEDLNQNGSINLENALSEEQNLLGNDAILDSVSFITFILELEERLTEEFETSFELLLDEIPGFSVDNPSLSIEGLIDYLRIKISLEVS